MAKSISGMVKISLFNNKDKHPKIREEIIKKLSLIENKKIEDVSQSYSIEKNKSELIIFPFNQTTHFIDEIPKILELDSYKNVKSIVHYKTIVEKKVVKKGKQKRTQEVTVVENKILEINN